MAKKVILFSSSNSKLQEFEMKTGHSICNRCAIRIELPLQMEEKNGELEFRTVTGRGFRVHPKSVEDNLLFSIPNNFGDAELVEGFAINTANSRHIFYWYKESSR